MASGALGLQLRRRMPNGLGGPFDVAQGRGRPRHMCRGRPPLQERREQTARREPRPPNGGRAGGSSLPKTGDGRDTFGRLSAGSARPSMKRRRTAADGGIPEGRASRPTNGNARRRMRWGLRKPHAGRQRALQRRQAERLPYKRRQAGRLPYDLSKLAALYIQSSSVSKSWRPP
jgi:hypothetical protein